MSLAHVFDENQADPLSGGATGLGQPGVEFFINAFLEQDGRKCAAVNARIDVDTSLGSLNFQIGDTCVG